MTNPDSLLKSRDITLPTKVHLVEAMVFPVVMYGCESWTVKKAEHQKTDDSELWCWRRLLRVLWTAMRSNQSILKEISPGCSLEGLMLKLNSNTLATSCEELTHWKRLWCWEGLGAGEGDDRGRDGWMASPTWWTWVWVSSGSWWWTGQGGLACCGSVQSLSRVRLCNPMNRSMPVHGVAKSRRRLSNWTELNWTAPTEGGSHWWILRRHTLTVIFKRSLHLETGQEGADWKQGWKRHLRVLVRNKVSIPRDRTVSPIKESEMIWQLFRRIVSRFLA